MIRSLKSSFLPKLSFPKLIHGGEGEIVVGGEARFIVATVIRGDSRFAVRGGRQHFLTVKRVSYLSKKMTEPANTP